MATFRASSSRTCNQPQWGSSQRGRSPNLNWNLEAMPDSVFTHSIILKGLMYSKTWCSCRQAYLSHKAVKLLWHNHVSSLLLKLWLMYVCVCVCVCVQHSCIGQEQCSPPLSRHVTHSFAYQWSLLPTWHKKLQGLFWLPIETLSHRQMHVVHYFICSFDIQVMSLCIKLTWLYTLIVLTRFSTLV